MTKVVGLHGRAPIEPNGADPEVVEYIEHLLEMAKNGDIVAIGVGIVAREGHVFTNSRGRGHKHELVACCEYLKHDLCEDNPK